VVETSITDCEYLHPTTQASLDAPQTCFATPAFPNFKKAMHGVFWHPRKGSVHSCLPLSTPLFYIFRTHESCFGHAYIREYGTVMMVMMIMCVWHLSEGSDKTIQACDIMSLGMRITFACFLHMDLYAFL
jgi:hypothetical protein